MSDNDLIRRGDVINVICEMHVGGKDAIEHALPNTYAEDLREIIYEVDDIPAVPQEMSAREYLEKKRMMCDSYCTKCDNCPMSPSVTGWLCNAYDIFLPEKAIAIIEKWAREHPEERSEE